MKKRLLIITFVLFLILSFANKTYANSIDETFDMLDTSEISDIASDNGLSFKTLVLDLLSGKVSLNPIDIFNNVIEKIFGEIILNIELIRNLVLIAVLSSFFTTMSSSFKSEETSKLASYTCYVAAVTILYDSFYLAYLISFDLINSIYNFCIASIPLISSAILLSGNPSFLVAFNPLLYIFIQTVIVLIKNVVLPFVLLIASIDIINKITDREILSNFCKTGKQIISWSLKGLSGLFISMLALARVTAPIADNLINKSAKVGISAVPVVGSSLSSALDTAVFLGKSAKNGAMSALIILLVIYLATYFIKLVSFVILYKIVAIVIEPISDKKLSNTISVVGDYVGYFLACTFFVATMFIFSILMIISL